MATIEVAEQIMVSDPNAEAEKIITRIPVGEGLLLESPLGDQLGLWRHSEDSVELRYNGNELRGSNMLAIRATARFLDSSIARVLAMNTIARAVEDTLGIKLDTPGIVQGPAGGMKN